MTILLPAIMTYLWAAFPSSYIAARMLKGIDLRQYGSGNIGSANLSTHVGKVIGLSVGAFDCLAKGSLPVLIAKFVGLGINEQIIIGIVAIVGHNWSPYIKFKGGRGVATTVGVLLGFLMWRELLILAIFFGIIGWLILKDTGFWAFVTCLVLAPVTFLFEVVLDGKSFDLVYLSLGIATAVFLKRLTANWERPQSGVPFMKVLFYRLIYDRDVSRKSNWINRQPSIDQQEASYGSD